MREHAPPLSKLRESRNLVRSRHLLSLGQGRSLRIPHATSKRENCMGSRCKKGEYKAQVSPKSMWVPVGKH